MTVTGRTFEKKRIKRKRTSASKKSTRNPQFNESLVFQVPKSLLCDIVMEVEVGGINSLNEDTQKPFLLLA